MSFAVNTAIDNAQRVFPDMSDTVGLVFFNQVRRDLHAHFKLRQASQDINLTNGTQEYAYSADFMNIESVHYVTASGVSVNLEPVEYSYLNKHERDWRDTAAGTPTRFYLTVGDTTSGPMVGLDPKPNTTTSAGFPIITVRGTKTVDMAAGETIYDDIPNTLVYEYGMCFHFARTEHLEEAEYWRLMMVAEYDRIWAYLLAKNHHLPEEYVEETAKTAPL